MKHNNQVFWGIILVVVGLVLGLNACGLANIHLFFNGWWTLFIIVPSLVGFLSGKDRGSNLIGLGIGIFLLLCCRGILNFSILWKLVFPALVVLFGLKMILGNSLDRNSAEVIRRIEGSGVPIRYGTAVFSGENLDFSGEVFQGAELNAVFGAVECDLRNAIIDEDCVVQASSVFGGITIHVPKGINVKVTSNSIFGGVSNDTDNLRDDTLPTLYIKGTCLFGGVEIQ